MKIYRFKTPFMYRAVQKNGSHPFPGVPESVLFGAGGANAHVILEEFTDEAFFSPG